MIEKVAVAARFGLSLLEFFSVSKRWKNCQRFIHELIQGIADLFAYAADVLIAFSNEQIHLDILGQKLYRLKNTD